MECLCGTNENCQKCTHPGCEVVFCSKFTDSCKFGKTDEKGYSLCRTSGMYCLYCKKYSCNKHWKKCGCCHYSGPVQCESCRDTCEFCMADLHKSCAHPCGDCERITCVNCAGYTDSNIISTWYYCKDCGKKYNSENDESE